MGLGPDSIKVENWALGKSKEREEKKEKGRKKRRDGREGGVGCWIKLKFMGRCSCMPFRSKVNSSISGISTNYGMFLQPLVSLICWEKKKAEREREIES